MAIRKIVARSIGVDVIVAEDLADNSITAAEITNGAVTADKLASNSVTTAKIAAGVTLTSPVMNTITSAAATALTLQSAGTTAITVDTSQNVGIGTTTTTPTNGRALIIYETTYPRLTLRNSTTGQTSTDGYGLVGVGNDLYVENAEAGNLAFTTSNTERMRIDSSGNVMTGATSATFASFTFKFSVTEGLAYTPFGINNNAGGTGASNSIIFARNGTQTGSITVTGTATSYNTSSDYRLKEAIAPMTGALAKVALLKPCNYKWIADGSDGQGFIAHEIQAVVPDCVVGEKDAVDDEGKPKYQGIDTSFLVATLTAAIQELKAENDTLKQRLDAAGL